MCRYHRCVGATSSTAVVAAFGYASSAIQECRGRGPVHRRGISMFASADLTGLQRAFEPWGRTAADRRFRSCTTARTDPGEDDDDYNRLPK